MKHAVSGAMALAIAALCAPAQAQAPVQVIAYTAKPVNLRAGPSRDYPVVAVLPGGFQVLVQGCLETYAWCDVTAGYDRGWVYAGNITYQYDNQWQPLASWAPVIGIAVLPFVFDDYWHQHYWNRPFYQDRWRWDHVPPPRYVRPPSDDGRRRNERPGAPRQWPRAVAPGQPQPGMPPSQRPPGWHGERGVAPVPRPVPPPQARPQPQPHPQPQYQPPPQPRYQPPQQQPRPQPQPHQQQSQQRPPPGHEQQGPRGEHERDRERR
jgi:uncharacterized protein YraI